MLRYRYILLILSLCWLSCEHKADDIFIRTESKGQQSIKLGAQLEIQDLVAVELPSFPHIKAPGDLDFFGDYMVVMDLLGDTTVSIFDLKSFKLTARLGVKGFGPDEIMAPFFVSPIFNTNSFYVFDRQQNKITLYSNQVSSFESEQFKVSDLLYQPLSVDGNEFIAISRVGQGRLVFFNRQGDLRFHGKIPEFGKGKPSDAERVSALEGFSAFSKKNNTLVLASLFSDRIQIFNLTGEEILSLNGPEFFDPIYVPQKVSSERYVISRKMNTKYAFADVYAADDFFYVLYSGTVHEDSPRTANQGRTIYCFDYDGMFIRKFNLDRQVLKIAVDEKNKKIYGSDVSSENPGVVVYDYSALPMQ